MLMQKCDALCQTYFYHSSPKYTKFQRFHLPSKSCKGTCHRKVFGLENICLWIRDLLMSINPRQPPECIFYFNPSKSEIIFKYAWWSININLFTVCFFIGWAVLLLCLKVIPVFIEISIEILLLWAISILFIVDLFDVVFTKLNFSLGH